MIYICQIILESGARSPAFSVSSIVDFVRDVHKHALGKGDWEDIKQCGLLILNAVPSEGDEMDSICTSALPVYSIDRYLTHLESGIDLPDLQLSSIVETFEGSSLADTLEV